MLGISLATKNVYFQKVLVAIVSYGMYVTSPNEYEIDGEQVNGQTSNRGLPTKNPNSAV